MTRNEVENIFEKHWEYYKKQGAETLKQQSGQIEQVAGDYQGRVLYELLQNAFDKAKNKILIKVDNDYLYVANDGEQFTFTQEYDYENGKSQRADFQSLCSISTSTKNAATSIGNKGVGFKSVYSLHCYADIFVKPKILNTDVKIDDKWISFRVYDEIKEASPEDFNNFNNVSKQLEWVTQEYPNRGIPGFYYPILLEDETITDFDDYVTIVRVKHNDKIKELIEEIEKIHFYFISLKYDKQLEIQINNNTKMIKDNNIVKTALNTITIQDLVKKTTIKIDRPQVALKYKKKSDQYDDLIYNYMPTKVVSPFKYVDFQGDFQSTIDRKGIDLDKGDIAAYNKALLQACIELHFLTFSYYLEKSNVELNLEYIDKNDFTIRLLAKIKWSSSTIPLTLKDFQYHYSEFCKKSIQFDKDKFWKYLRLNDTMIKQQTVGIIKNIFNNDWNNFGKFISLLAKKYFDQKNLKMENFDNFWEVIKQYTEINSYENIWTIGFKDKIRDIFLRELFENEVQCVYVDKVIVTTLGEHLYFKDNEANLDLSFLNVKLTSYNFSELSGGFLTDQIINKEQRFIHKYSDINEILKHFRQISRDGSISNEESNEERQKNIINTIFQIYLAKTESNFLSTHRYEELLSNKPNKDYTKIAANFAVSTIFLKIKDKEIYKPARYCHYSELDIEFLELQIPNDKKDIKSIEDFLKFLGVSFDENIKYIDKLSDKSEFFKGLDYIPFLIRDTDIQEESSKTPYIPNMRIQYKDSSGKEICKHPALFYKTSTYNGILNEIKSKDTEKESLNLVVKNLEDYPEKYIDELVNKEFDMKDIDEAVVFKFYNEIFKKYSKKYLIYKYDRTFEWLEENKLDKTNKSFLIAKTKEDFDLLKNKTNILATFSDVSDNDNLKVLQARIEKSIVNNDEKDSKSIKKQLDVLIPYILLSISKSDKESRKNFLEDQKDELKAYFDKWQELEFKQLDEIKLNIKLKDQDEWLGNNELERPILLEKIVYYKEKNELYDFAFVMADFFNVGTLQTNIENILLKGKEKAKDNFDVLEIEQVLSMWINIDDDIKNKIIEELKRIGFKNDIYFKLSYFKSDLDKCIDKLANITQSELQEKINNIIKPENLKITFNCEDENSTLIKKIIDKYRLIELSIDNIQKAQLIQKVYLKEEDIFAIFEKMKEQLDEELERLTRENLKDTYKLIQIPKESGEQLSSTEISESTTTVDNFFTNHHSARNIKIAQNRGLRIEEELVKELAEKFKLKVHLQASIKIIFDEIKEQKLSDGKTPRYNLKNQDKYEKLLKDENTKLSDLLHMSKILGDGLGFDILYPKIEDNGNMSLLKVEVKSSFDGKNIYLSENERKQILLSKDDKKFKIYLYIREKEPLDITEIVRNVLCENNNFSNITAETWIINL
ncbi:hypothetical protein N5T82_10190 [Aliarcobacter cryaerophilus]|uniref:sacsin N-terminal ATP-binding-like domain-containing protein n=1 Tax=Aliarcobacter cryaerophilus TaxID=28198 RepID=UPI0021B625D5|nr:hypothetical protein [Aliarcobacter cryaerophilus]MCT7540212.1 hypothetical protein [Aliarcobacter cryaerophilus]